MKHRMAAAFFALAMLALVVVIPASAGRGNGPTGLVFVASQGLYFDTFVTADLPFHGRFQRLYPGIGPNGASITMYGPGDPGYLGGRWWVDVNGNNEMDEGDDFFLCPLLGPGRENP
jgi:hypothetical protein